MEVMLSDFIFNIYIDFLRESDLGCQLAWLVRFM